MSYVIFYTSYYIPLHSICQHILLQNSICFDIISIKTFGGVYLITLDINTMLEQRGRSCYWLAKQCNVSQNNMSKICNGETISIKFEILEKICKALECTPNDLIVSTDPQINRLLNYYNELSKNINADDTE